MRGDGAAIREFLGLKRIALVGASHDPAHFSRAVLRELLARGFDVVPVNPAGGEIEGRPVIGRLQDVEPEVEGALIMTPATAAVRVVEDCIDAGISRVWLHRGVGVGATSDEAVQVAREAGLSVVGGECPLMFFEDAVWVHRAHGAGKRLAGSWPLEEPASGGRGLALGLGLLQAFVGLGAVPAGLGFVIDPTGEGLGMTVDLLSHSPFEDFLVPGLVLLVGNGIGSLLGAALSLLGRRAAGEVAVLLGAFLALWIVAQVSWIGLVSGLQPLMFVVGLVEIALGIAVANRANGVLPGLPVAP